MFFQYFFIYIFDKNIEVVEMVVRSIVKGIEFGEWNFVVNVVNFFVAIIDLGKVFMCVCDYDENGNGEKN